MVYGQFNEGHARAQAGCQEHCVAVGDWGFAQTAEEASQMGFMAINVDTMGWSLVLGLIFLLIFGRAAKQATTGVPSGLLNFVETVVDFIDDLVRSTFQHSGNALVAPMALTIFVWVFFMNLMDLIPVDWIPFVAEHYPYPLKVVPSTIRTSPCMAFGVFMLIVYYSIARRGLGLFFRARLPSVSEVDVPRQPYS